MPPFGKLRVTYAVHLWLVGKRVVDFLFVLIKLFKLLGAMSGYLSKFWFFKGGGSF